MKIIVIVVIIRIIIIMSRLKVCMLAWLVDYRISVILLFNPTWRGFNSICVTSLALISLSAENNNNLIRL